MNNTRLASLRVQKWYHILPIKPWYLLEIHEKVWEWSNARIWRFKGLVIKVKKPNHVDGTFTIRWKAAGHTIEKIYPLSFVNFDKVMLLDIYKIRRAKLYYIRDKVGKDARFASIALAEEKWIDLLSLGVEEAKKLHEAYLASQAVAVDEVDVAESVESVENEMWSEEQSEQQQEETEQAEQQQSQEAEQETQE